MDYDVAVIGGGPAGSTAAALNALAGRRVLLVERERFPRFHIGESLMPATYWTFERLGVLDRLHATPFPRKHSVQFFGADGRAGAPFYFSEVDPHESSVTWQVDRATFDALLLDHARSTGVDVMPGVNVRDVLFEGDRAVGLRLDGDDGPRDIPARVIVDASGQTSILARRFRLRRVDPVLRHAAVFTRFRGAVRDPGIDEGATLVMKTRAPGCWFWYIPLPHDEVSVGVVGPIAHLARGADLQKIFDEEVALCSAVVPRIENAEQSVDVMLLRDFSYISTRIAGDGWVLVGDAFGFLDPIYSTGVLLGLQSAEMATDSIDTAFARDDFSAETLGRHGDRYLAGMEAMRKLVLAYYAPEFHFGPFLRRFPHCRLPLVHLLTGNVFRTRVDPLFEAMEQICPLPEARRLDPAGAGA
jgi:flavin-dependent dehydrogenase